MTNQIEENNSVNGMTVLMNLQTNTDHITFEVAGKQQQVRVVGTCQKPWFNGLDVCAILEYSDAKTELQRHVKQKYKKSLGELSSEVEDDLSSTYLGSGNLQNLSYNDGKAVYINEPGFYRLVLKSKARLAEAFQELVCDYVLPTLRQHGSVSVEGIQRQLEDLKLEQQNQAQIIELKDRELQDQAAALAAEEDKRKRAERKSLRIGKLMKHASIKEKKEEWIYIATTDIYSRDRIFKIGSTERLVRRIDGYQTGRPKEDQYYYAYLKKVYASKDLDYHIQRLLSDFKHNEKGEMYIGIKFEDLCNILTVICDNYDRSLDYVYGFVKARLPESQEEGEDEPPPPIDLSMITIHYGEHEEEIVLSEDSVKGMLQDILSNIECKTVNNVLVYQRKDLIEELGKIFVGSKRKSIWEATKKAIGWKSSKSELTAPSELVDGVDMFMIQY